MEGPISSGAIAILIDHNIEGQAAWLWDTLEAEGWLEIIPVEMVMFKDVGLAIDSNDRAIWRFAQAHRFILLTANRNMDGEDSLEQTLRDENKETSLPILTISKVEYLEDRTYRKKCAAEALLEIVINLDNYLGTARMFIP